MALNYKDILALMYMYAVQYAIATKPLILLKTSPYTYTHMYNVVVLKMWLSLRKGHLSLTFLFYSKQENMNLLMTRWKFFYCVFWIYTS